MLVNVIYKTQWGGKSSTLVAPASLLFLPPSLEPIADGGSFPVHFTPMGPNPSTEQHFFDGPWL